MSFVSVECLYLVADLLGLGKGLLPFRQRRADLACICLPCPYLVIFEYPPIRSSPDLHVIADGIRDSPRLGKHGCAESASYGTVHPSSMQLGLANHTAFASTSTHHPEPSKDKLSVLQRIAGLVCPQDLVEILLGMAHMDRGNCSFEYIQIDRLRL